MASSAEIADIQENCERLIENSKVITSISSLVRKDHSSVYYDNVKSLIIRLIFVYTGSR